MAQDNKANTSKNTGDQATNSINNPNDSELVSQNSTITPYIASLKIPPFWGNRPDLWFLQVETQFRVKGITVSNTKYDHLVSSLPPETMELVADILLNPPPQEKYENLKAALLARSRDSEERRLDALLHKIQLGDYKPSELFRHMETLAGGNSLVNTPLLKKLWLNKLPSSVQACVIAIEGAHSQEEIFNIADRIFDSLDSPKISSVQTSKHPVPDNNTRNITDMLQDLFNRLTRLESRQSRSRRRSSPRNTFRSNSPLSFERGQQICWYHKHFRNNAKKCIEPCKYNTNNHNTPKNEE